MATESFRIVSNPTAISYTSTPSNTLTTTAILDFHASIPAYSGPTRLVHLPSLHPNFKSLYMKDESHRLSLPYFKPLGLSWAIRNAIIDELSEQASFSSLPAIPEDISLLDLAAKAKEGQIKLIAASDGKLGQTVARLGKCFGIEGINTRIFVPHSVAGNVLEEVRAEGVEAIEVNGDLEDAMREAVLHSVAVDGVFVDLEEEEGYEDVPRWIVEGYSTIFNEMDVQLGGKHPDLVIVPVGIGGLAQAAVMHYKSPLRKTHYTRVVAVEPEVSSALQASLRKGERVNVKTDGSTILKNLAYGHVAEKAWEVLRDGLDMSTVVKDEEVEVAMRDLKKAGMEVGPCGGAVLAALKSLPDGNTEISGVDYESVVVLIATEGVR